jgi:hypothetical protein
VRRRLPGQDKEKVGMRAINMANKDPIMEAGTEPGWAFFLYEKLPLPGTT